MVGGAAPEGAGEDLQDLCGEQYNEADGFALFEAIMAQILDLSARARMLVAESAPERGHKQISDLCNAVGEGQLRELCAPVCP